MVSWFILHTHTHTHTRRTRTFLSCLSKRSRAPRQEGFTFISIYIFMQIVIAHTVNILHSFCAWFFSPPVREEEHSCQNFEYMRDDKYVRYTHSSHTRSSHTRFRCGERIVIVCRYGEQALCARKWNLARAAPLQHSVPQICESEEKRNVKGREEKDESRKEMLNGNARESNGN